MRGGQEYGRWPGDEPNDGLSRRRFSMLGAAALCAAGVRRAAGAAPPAPGGRTAAPVGIALAHEQFRTPDIVRFAELADRAGFGHVWTSDHFQPWQDNEGHAMFPWLTLALIGERTSHLTYGTGVTCPLYRHHPSEVAQAFASLGVLYPGRVFLGVGTGESLNELAATGRFGRYPERHDRLIEAIRLIRRLWTGERVTFDGTYYRTDQAKLYDVPDRPVPIYVAASGPKSAYLAGRYGDGWIGGVKDLGDRRLREEFARGARAAGRDPDGMPKIAETWVVVGGRAETNEAARKWRFTVHGFGDLLYQPNPVTIQRLAEQRWPLEKVYSAWPRGTDPQVHITALQRLLNEGVTPFIHSGQTDQRHVIDFYGREVLPHLRR
ncbi:F420-dependent hydroxymycolic acid dehydrogenase [Actinoallomurus rhizosphaericola]|uniref:F420-dependent hydroxymycolic acid dehydrogenase n=1 Tax=Actinoallomurus rhizosphaericola TaxID=2952536 RepID=UPI00209268C3|nr:F420-dependent hydroxymycolic acid dehydrogenase [Actinoallomurus rhizosphaericola]MCO5995283.1 F420-dependent hydroxymycolic acid dehydrogenase [Actinoallomurus rhizosphaericola]